VGVGEKAVSAAVKSWFKETAFSMPKFKKEVSI